jgi:hypothetical protein
METAGIKKKADNRNLTDPHYAFGHYINDACIKRGEELVKEVVEERKKKAESVKKEIYQQSKEAATYLAGKARGRITLTGGVRYSCFTCQYRGKGLKDEHGQSLCGFKCNNGEYYNPIGEESDDQEHKQ